jgi:hypothetical protein
MTNHKNKKKSENTPQAAYRKLLRDEKINENSKAYKEENEIEPSTRFCIVCQLHEKENDKKYQQLNQKHKRDCPHKNCKCVNCTIVQKNSDFQKKRYHSTRPQKSQNTAKKPKKQTAKVSSAKKRSNQDVSNLPIERNVSCNRLSMYTLFNYPSCSPSKFYQTSLSSSLKALSFKVNSSKFLLARLLQFQSLT